MRRTAFFRNPERFTFIPLTAYYNWINPDGRVGGTTQVVDSIDYVLSDYGALAKYLPGLSLQLQALSKGEEAWFDLKPRLLYEFCRQKDRAWLIYAIAILRLGYLPYLALYLGYVIAIDDDCDFSPYLVDIVVKLAPRFTYKWGVSDGRLTPEYSNSLPSFALFWESNVRVEHTNHGVVLTLPSSQDGRAKGGRRQIEPYRFRNQSESNYIKRRTMLSRLQVEPWVLTARFDTNSLVALFSMATSEVLYNGGYIQKPSVWISVLKDMTGIVKNVQKKCFPPWVSNKYPRLWMLITDLESMIGQRKVEAASSDFADQVREWLLAQPVVRPLWLIDHMQLALSTSVFKVKWGQLHRQLTVAEFLADRSLYSTGGSSYGSGTKALEGMKANKWSAAYSLTLSELLTLFYDDSPSVLKPIPKLELTKVRAVINSPYPMYLRMSYVDYHLSQLLSGCPYTTLTMNQRQWDDRFLKFVDFSGRQFRMPLDQSKFDHGPNFEMFTMLLKLIRSYLIKFTSNQVVLRELLGTMDILDKDLSLGHQMVSLDGEVYVMTSGLASGWRWTSLFGSLLNVGALIALSSTCPYGPDLGITSVIAQGDDDAMVAPSAAALASLVQRYQAAGFNVNPRKFWINNYSDEFLRVMYTQSSACGYPTRAFLKQLVQVNDPNTGVPPEDTVQSPATMLEGLAQMRFPNRIRKHMRSIMSSLLRSGTAELVTIKQKLLGDIKTSKWNEKVSSLFTVAARFAAATGSQMIFNKYVKMGVADLAASYGISGRLADALICTPKILGGTGIVVPRRADPGCLAILWSQAPYVWRRTALSGSLLRDQQVRTLRTLERLNGLSEELRQASALLVGNADDTITNDWSQEILRIQSGNLANRVMNEETLDAEVQPGIHSGDDYVTILLLSKQWMYHYLQVAPTDAYLLASAPAVLSTLSAMVAAATPTEPSKWALEYAMLRKHMVRLKDASVARLLSLVDSLYSTIGRWGVVQDFIMTGRAECFVSAPYLPAPVTRSYQRGFSNLILRVIVNPSTSHRGEKVFRCVMAAMATGESLASDAWVGAYSG